MSSVQLLWTLVAGQLLLMALAWTATIPISRGLRGGAVGLVAFNLALGLSLLLIGLRDELPYFVGHTFSNFLSLWALVAIIQAADQILKIKISQREIWVVMTLAGAGILGFGLSPETANWRVLLLFLAITWMLVRNGLLVWQLKTEPHLRMPVKSIAVISMGLAALLLVRAMAGLVGQASIEFTATDKLTLFLPFLLLVGVSMVNLGFAYLALSSVFTRLRNLARSDELTGLLNRKALTEEIDRAWLHFTKTRQTFALICLDIDNLRAVNATHGYGGGDAVLKDLAISLQEMVRSCDFIGRAGGGKIVSVLTNTGLDEARGLAEHMRVKVADLRDLFSDGRVKLSASVGVAVSLMTDASEQQVLERANANMATAKAAGRNQVQWESKEDQATIQSAPEHS